MEQKGEESCPNQNDLLEEERLILHKNQKMSHKCNICDKICNTINGLDVHIKAVHSGQIHTCNVCEKP